MAYELEQHYAGDQAWHDFVKATATDGQGTMSEELVRKAGGHHDVASVICFFFGDSSLSWMTQAVPALDGLTPQECLATPLLTNRLKSMLMRMPC